MDRSIQKQLYGLSRSRESISGVRRSMPASGATPVGKSGFGGNASFAPSPLSGGLRKNLHNSRLSLSVRSTQSIPGIRSDYNAVESYGCPLPVVVNEALTFAGALPGTVSAKVSQNGWAWVVQGRRLLIWQYKDSTKVGSPPRGAKQQRRGGTLAQCRELTLPYSDLAHKSGLISVFQTEGQQTASCIAVSSTGDVRYWSSIAHDGNSVDLSILAGQEFVQLLNLPTQQGFLAVTSTSNLVFLRVALTKGRYTLHHKIIKPATSLLGGFGKKFASILIGSTGGEKDQYLVGMCCESNSLEGETIVSVLTDRSIQRWSLSKKGNAENLIFEDVELVRKIREEFQQKFWNIRLPADNTEIDLHLLDYHVTKGKAYILAGAVNQSHAPQMCYGVVVTSPLAESMFLDSFTPLKLNKFFSPKTVQDCLCLRFIVTSSHFYLYTPKTVYPLHLSQSVPTAEVEAEKIEFHLHDDRILSAAVCNRLPLFFSRTHGLVSITPGDFDSTDMLNMSSCHTPDLFAPTSFNGSFSVNAEQSIQLSSSNNLNMFDIDPDDVYNELTDEVGHLKAAFLYCVKGNHNMVKTIVGELLRNVAEADPNGAPLDAYKLDRIVITIAEDLAEDLPIADPRWEDTIEEQQESNRHGLGSSRSMQIINQLRDKVVAMQHFIEFLHSSGVWDKLNAIPCGSNVLKPTGYILSDISEKIIAALALRSLQTKMPKLIEEAIDTTVALWEEKPYGSLTTQDIFYVKICNMQCIFETLADMADERIAAQQQTTLSVAHSICDINVIVLEILDMVFRYREQHSSSFQLHNDKLASFENLPWTAMSGNAGVRDTLTRLIHLSVRFGTHSVSETELKQQLYQQISELVDVVLEGRKNYLESVRETEKFNVLQQQFEAQRRELISMLIKERQYQYAAKLAEKYLDFQSLVIICDETKDKDRLDDYTRKYEEYDFSQFAINWHMRQNRHGEVFERFKGNQTALAQFMRDHPSLGWIQLVLNGDFERTAKVLDELAQNETEFVSRKKSMLSLAKLAALAASDSDMTANVEKINTDLTIVEYQSHLGHDILQNFGYDSSDQKVLKVEEIINLFIAEENDTASEGEFRKALELLNYVEHPYEMRRKIWCAAIRRDNWTDYDPNNAVEYMQKMLFFRIIEISQLIGEEGENYLPPMEEFLDSNELGDLPQQKSFQYLLKLTYEYATNMFKNPAEDMDVQ
ncbi:uncharacterized protein Dwil_GK22571 [Drosophila willistoni]|uniref:Nucleoporin Nup133/Nup155-like N-terminal domain-containing protein n=2 Tax=Drosophila willistoni TaxID=7260 RepID=B4NF89_DROWI|nr:uncharacterized protein Dwil_GK22571 [Drosophila willistoni]